MGKQKTLALIAVANTNFMVMLALLPFSAILPTIAKHFDVDVTTAGWVMTSFLLSLSSFLLISGRLGDLYGHRGVFLLGTVIYAIVSVASGFTSDIWVLIALRSVQGLGGAMVLGNSLAIITHMFTDEERSTAIGVARMAAASSGLFGVTVSSLLAQYLSWQWLFYLAVPFGLVGVQAGLGLRVNFRPIERPKIDYLGAILLVATLIPFSLSLNHLHSETGGFSEGLFYHGGMLAATAVALLLFVMVEMRAPQPMVDLSCLLNRSFLSSISANGILHMTMLISFFVTPFLLERGMHLPPVYTAGVIISTQLGNMGFSLGAGVIFDRTRWKFICPAAMAVMCVGLGALGFFAPAMSYLELLVASFVVGASGGFFFTPNNTIAMGMVPVHLRGFAAGALETTTQLGHTLGIAVPVSVLGAALAEVAYETSQVQAYVGGYQQATLIAAALAFLGVFVSLVHPFRLRPARALADSTSGA